MEFIPHFGFIYPTLLGFVGYSHLSAGFSLGHLHMGDLSPPYGGDKSLMGGTHEGGHRPHGGT